MHVEENKQIQSVTKRIFRDLNRIKGKVVNYSIIAFVGIFVYRVWNGVIPPGKTASDIMGRLQNNVPSSVWRDAVGFSRFCFYFIYEV